jgi:7-cyano-7-deazaguanine synthase
VKKGHLHTASKAVVLLSGGVDSATVLALAKAQGYSLYALTFDYGQRHALELQAAAAVARHAGVEKHLVLRIDLNVIGHSALTDTIDVPKGRSSDEMAGAIPVTYVPARNTIFLSHALAWAEVLRAPHIFIGVHSLDYSGYPDCRPAYIKAFEAMANLAIKAAVEGTHGITIEAPLIDMTKAQIIRLGHSLGVNYALTLSCYDPSPEGLACGLCDSCIIRKRGFVEAPVPDPTQYVS